MSLLLGGFLSHAEMRDLLQALDARSQRTIGSGSGQYVTAYNVWSIGIPSVEFDMKWEPWDVEAVNVPLLPTVRFFHTPNVWIAFTSTELVAFSREEKDMFGGRKVWSRSVDVGVWMSVLWVDEVLLWEIFSEKLFGKELLARLTALLDQKKRETKRHQRGRLQEGSMIRIHQTTKKIKRMCWNWFSELWTSREVYIVLAELYLFPTLPQATPLSPSA